MKCEMCGKGMTSARENYNYWVCGSLHVTLKDVEVYRCQNCGEHSAVISRVLDLHQAIAERIAAKKCRLLPDEIKFLRKHMGWSETEFAQQMGVTIESVSRWEHKKEPMGSAADRLLRLLVVIKASEKDHATKIFSEIRNEIAPELFKLTSSRNGKTWRPELAIA